MVSKRYNRAPDIGIIFCLGVISIMYPHLRGICGRVVNPKHGPVLITLSMTVETQVGIPGGGWEGENMVMWRQLHAGWLCWLRNAHKHWNFVLISAHPHACPYQHQLFDWKLCAAPNFCLACAMPFLNP